MKVVMIMPGYGSQFLGMSKELYDNYRIVQEYFEQANQCLDINFVKLCFASSENELAKPLHAYTALFLTQTAIAAVLAAEEIPVSLFVGHNTGDYAAIAAAGGISLPDGLYLLHKYAQFYQVFLDEHPSNIIRISANAKTIASLINSIEDQGHTLGASHYYQENEIAVSGSSDAIHALIRLCNDRDISYQEEDLGYELHNPYAQPLVNTFQPYLTKIDFKALLAPVMRSMDRSLITSSEEIAQTIVDRITYPTRFDILLEALDGADCIAHCGLEDRLTNIIAHRYPNKPLITINQRSDIMQLKNMINKPTTVDEIIKE